MWKQINVNIGDIKPKQLKEATFEYIGTIPKILRISPGCGCTNVKQVGNTIKATISINNFPKQIQGAESIGIKKNIVIYYTNHNLPNQVLYIVGKLLKTT